ncbi:MAG: long-chain acyl-CoA synthetase [Halieaceae bacterium]|jgi:long-chain acyl-CoA synthetase
MNISVADIHAKRDEITGPGGFFELEDLVIDGFTYPVFKHAPKTAIEVIQSSRNHGDLEFIVYEDERLTFNDYFASVDALAASLQNELGVTKGDRVALAMRNNPAWAISFAAATLIGAVVVPINSWGKTEELMYAVTDSGATVLICDPARLKLIVDKLSELDAYVVVVGHDESFSATAKLLSFPALLAAAQGQEYKVDQASPEDITLILYTSGSTGFPKGVVHRHIAVTQSLMNMMYLGFLVMELEGAREFRGGASRETPMLTVPLFHCTGLLSGYYIPLQMGHKAVMMYKWDSDKALQLIQDEKVTGLSSVPAIVQDLLSSPEFDKYDTSSLIRVAAAGAATPAGLPELIMEKIGNPSRSAGFGMTETMALGSAMSGIIFDMKYDTSGLVSPIVKFRSVDAAGNVLSQGEPGEIELYGVTITPGYWEKPEANASTFDENRWMKTGDVGMVDADEFVHITGRIKEIVIRGGENIYPGEIEFVAYELDAVHEVVVFGEPDAALGEELVMVAYLRPGAELTEAALRIALNNRLASYKVPRIIRFSQEPLPRNASEKLHKLKVREAYLEDKAAT